MTTPRFSVLIPTRDRPDTLRHTLSTVTAQDGDDYEIVVADNCGGPETRAVVEQCGSPSVRYTRSDEVLPMAVNWERGLALCSGEYVTVLGDDDGFMPSTLPLARKLIAATAAPGMISWRAHVYWYPDTIAHWNRNRLFVNLGSRASRINSRPVLEQFYRSEISISLLPTIYSGFFHRRVIEEARRRYRGFFVPPDTPPDVSSGILGLHLTDTFVHSALPLTIRGNSVRSNGTAQWIRSLGASQRETYYREERVGMRGLTHDTLVPSPNLNILIASCKLKCKELYFPGDAALTLDPRTVVRDLLDSLNHDPDAYDDNLDDAKRLAAKLGMALEARDIPARERRERTARSGPITNPQGVIDCLGVNGDLAGLANIADAARLAESLLPPAGQFLEARDAAPAEAARGVAYDTSVTARAVERPRSQLGMLLSGLLRGRKN